MRQVFKNHQSLRNRKFSACPIYHIYLKCYTSCEEVQVELQDQKSVTRWRRVKGHQSGGVSKGTKVEEGRRAPGKWISTRASGFFFLLLCVVIPSKALSSKENLVQKWVFKLRPKSFFCPNCLFQFKQGNIFLTSKLSMELISSLFPMVIWGRMASWAGGIPEEMRLQEKVNGPWIQPFWKAFITVSYPAASSRTAL